MVKNIYFGYNQAQGLIYVNNKGTPTGLPKDRIYSARYQSEEVVPINVCLENMISSVGKLFPKRKVHLIFGPSFLEVESEIRSLVNQYVKKVDDLEFKLK